MVVYKNFNDLNKAILQKTADVLISKAQDNIIEMGISDTGDLLGSDEQRPLSDDSMEVGFYLPYAEYVNSGTNPHSINPGVLYDWVRRKLGIKKEHEIKAVAEKIAWKIRKNGTKPQPFWDNALAEIDNIKIDV